MNILYVTNHLNTGGITSYILTLARGLKQKGHNVYVASSKIGLLADCIAEGIVFIPIPINTKSELNPKILLSKLKLSHVIKQNNIHIVHSNSRTTQVLGYSLSKSLGVVHVTTCHGFFKNRLSRRIFPCWGSKVIAISESVMTHLVDDFKVRPQDIIVIHNGIDLDKFKISAFAAGGGEAGCKTERKKEFGLGEGPVVGIIARLSDVKGHRYLIEAMKEVLENVPAAQLVIVGEGRTEKKLIRLTRKLGIEGNVFFIPAVSETVRILPVMDVFVMPSLKEGLGLALMEAMAAGLAVIGSEVGGIKSLIRDDYNGLLVRPADVNQLSRAILRLLNDSGEREGLGVNARKFITENFSQETMISRTEEVYLNA
jgi:glycosyltransferase involved in cell wall biosynthesis